MQILKEAYLHLALVNQLNGASTLLVPHTSSERGTDRVQALNPKFLPILEEWHSTTVDYDSGHDFCQFTITVIYYEDLSLEINTVGVGMNARHPFRHQMIYIFGYRHSRCQLITLFLCLWRLSRYLPT